LERDAFSLNSYVTQELRDSSILRSLHTQRLLNRISFRFPDEVNSALPLINIFQALRGRFGFTALTVSLRDVSTIKLHPCFSLGFTFYPELITDDRGDLDYRSIRRLDFSEISDLEGVESALEVARRSLEVFEDFTRAHVAWDIVNEDCANFLSRRVQQ